jgi:hypothetical protein
MFLPASDQLSVTTAATAAFLGTFCHAYFPPARTIAPRNDTRSGAIDNRKRQGLCLLLLCRIRRRYSDGQLIISLVAPLSVLTRAGPFLLLIVHVTAKPQL